LGRRIAQRPEAGGKTLFDLPAYRFQALWTNLPRRIPARARRMASRMKRGSMMSEAFASSFMSQSWASHPLLPRPKTRIQVENGPNQAKNRPIQLDSVWINLSFIFIQLDQVCIKLKKPETLVGDLSILQRKQETFVG